MEIVQLMIILGFFLIIRVKFITKMIHLVMLYLISSSEIIGAAEQIELTKICKQIRTEKLLPSKIADNFNKYAESNKTDSQPVVFLIILSILITIEFPIVTLVVISLVILRILFKMDYHADNATFRYMHNTFDLFMITQQSLYFDSINMGDYDIYAKFEYKEGEHYINGGNSCIQKWVYGIQRNY